MLIMKSSENDFISLPAFHLIMCLMKDPKDFFENKQFSKDDSLFPSGVSKLTSYKKN